MENLNEKDYENIKNAILTFNALDKNEKKEIERKINIVWSDVFDKFCEFCSNDKKLNELHDFVEDFKKVTNFSMEEHFQKYSYTINEFDPEMEEDVYDYDMSAQLRAEEIFSNLEKLKAEARAQIEKINNAKFVFNRALKIKKLEDEIEDYDRIAENFAKLKEKDDMKNDYLKNHFNEYTENKKQLKALIEKYAEQTISEALKENPGLACIEHKSFISSTKYKTYDMHALNDACNKARSDALELLENDKNKLFVERNELGDN